MKLDKQHIDTIDQIKSHEDRIFAAALMYIEAGFFVIPIREDGKAIPKKEWNLNYSHASKKKDKIRSWFGPQGKFKGWNIGLACGRSDGVMAIDLDVNKETGEEVGQSSFDTAKPQDYIHSGPIQITPSGGRHFLHEWGESGRSTQGALGKGIDTRGGDAAQCRSHIVAWPSMIRGQMYKWSTAGEVQPMPQWVSDTLGVGWQTKEGGGGGRGNEGVEDGDAEQIFPIHELQRMLSFIPLDSKDGVHDEHQDPQGNLRYDIWINIGQIIHSQHPSPEGFQVWNQWSTNGSRYEPTECSNRWDGFKSHGPMRIGSLVFWAREYGYELPTQDTKQNINIAPEEVTDIVETMNKDHALVIIGGKTAVMWEQEYDDSDPRGNPNKMLTRNALKEWYENKTITVMAASGVVRVNPVDIWFADGRRREYMNGLSCMPGKTQGFKGKYNTWTGFTRKPKPGDWSQFESHIRDVICAGDEDIATWLLDWCADMFQNPGIKPGTALVLQGHEGCGKGIFTSMLGRLLGPHYTQVIDESGLLNKFNAHMTDAVLLLADEVTFGGYKKDAGKYKGLVSEPYIMRENKGYDSISTQNNIHLVIHSNEEWSIPAGPQSRRWLCLAVSNHMSNKRAYFDGIVRQMEEEDGLAAFLHDMLERDITSNLRVAPVTEMLEEQREKYTKMDPQVEFMAEMIDNMDLLFEDFNPVEDLNNPDRWPEVITKGSVWPTYQVWLKGRVGSVRPGTSGGMAKVMKQLGFTDTNKSRQGKRTKCWGVPPHQEAVINLHAQYGIKPEDDEDEES